MPWGTDGFAALTASAYLLPVIAKVAKLSESTGVEVTSNSRWGRVAAARKTSALLDTGFPISQPSSKQLGVMQEAKGSSSTKTAACGTRPNSGPKNPARGRGVTSKLRIGWSAMLCASGMRKRYGNTGRRSACQLPIYGRHDARTLETVILHLPALFNHAELQSCSNRKLQPSRFMIGLGSNMRSRKCAGTST